MLHGDNQQMPKQNDRQPVAKPHSPVRTAGLLIAVLGIASAQGTRPGRAAELPLAPADQPAASAPPARACALLPESGHYAALANAIHIGLESAAGQPSPPPRLAIRRYDTQGQPQAAAAAYRQALRDGCAVIIGPLLRQEAATVIGSRQDTDPPLLTLTPIATPVQKGLYQFGLPPEQEMEQIAEDAWTAGYRHPALIFPQNEMGTRLRDAFVQAWRHQGGQVAAATPLPARNEDPDGLIRRALGLDETQPSEADGNAAVPASRSAADFVLLLVSDVRARALMPALRSYALDLPVFSSSRVYSTQPDPLRDSVLDGLSFVDMPWLLSPGEEWTPLRQELAQKLPARNEITWRLAALGLDSYQIALRIWQGQTQSAYAGATGLISFADNGILQRRLIWAAYEQGQVRLRNGPPPKLHD